MPYIKREDRDRLWHDNEMPDNKGELCYMLYWLAYSYVHDHAVRLHGGRFTYNDISDAMAALRDAEREIEHRIYTPHERDAMLENGDVFPGEREFGYENVHHGSGSARGAGEYSPGRPDSDPSGRFSERLENPSADEGQQEARRPQDHEGSYPEDGEKL